jgi:TolB-like protein/tetratricopeptide (TPR) repeat protein
VTGQESPQRWERVERLFRAALDVPASERASLVATTAEDAGVRDEVERLLASHEAATDFLEALDPRHVEELLDSAATNLAAGDQVGPYRIVDMLGCGGMGVVYRAHDPRLDRTIALKLLPPDATDPVSTLRLAREARAASALDHPHIASVYELGETEDGIPYIAMACVEGETLAQRLQAGPLDVDEAIAIATMIADGLGAAHQRGIVHRDIKPSNLIVTPDGTVKIVDFGIARLDEAEFTRTGVKVGSIAYMSPERLAGEKADPRSDIWSLGIVLHEMVTGRRPRPGDTSPLPAAARIPKRIEQILSRCLAPDPAHRYPDASALLVELRQAGKRSSSKRSRGRWGVMAALSGAGLIALVAALLVTLRGRDGTPARNLDPAPSSVASAAPIRVAMLPLANLTPDSTADMFADGMTEQVIDRLSEVAGLRVIARSSVLRYGDRDAAPAEIGSTLGVDYVLEGTVRAAGDTLHTSLQLVEASSGEIRWSRAFAPTALDAPEIQTAILTGVTDALGVDRAWANRHAGPGTDDREAYLAYFEGRYRWNRRTPEGMQRGKELIERALELDPTWGRAWVGLADAYVTLGSYGMLPSSEAYPRARAAAERALALDESDAGAHAVLGSVFTEHYYDWNFAERHYRRAILLGPSDANAFFWYSEHLAFMGRFDEAIAMSRRGADLDPLSAVARADEGRALYYARRHDAAIEVFDEILADGPDFVAALYKGLALAESERLDEAAVTLETAHETFHQIPTMNALLAYVHGRSGRHKDARRILADLHERYERGSVQAVDIAAVHLGLGEIERALDWLETAHADRNWQMAFLGVEPIFDPLRARPRFQALIERLDFPPSVLHGRERAIQGVTLRMRPPAKSLTKNEPSGAKRIPAGVFRPEMTVSSTPPISRTTAPVFGAKSPMNPVAYSSTTGFPAGSSVRSTALVRPSWKIDTLPERSTA